MKGRELTTERFVLRPVDTEDANPLHALWTDPHVRRFLWEDEIIPRQQTMDIVTKNISQFEEAGCGIWAVRERGAEELVGFAGFWHFRTPPSLELLFGVASPHWHRGIATESSWCLIDYGFQTLGFDAIDASTDVGNDASVRVLEKLGMRFQRRERIDGLDTLFYVLSFDDWRTLAKTSA